MSPFASPYLESGWLAPAGCVGSSQWYLVVSCLEVAKETCSMRYCCFALALWAAALDEGHGRMLSSVLET